VDRRHPPGRAMTFIAATIFSLGLALGVCIGRFLL
jgi:hypothetical protein